MHRRRLLVASGFLLTVSGIALSAGAAYAYVWNRSHADAIARGVTIAGVDVGGLHAAEARTLLEQRLGAQLRKPVTISYGSHTFVVRPAKAGLRVDLDRMVDEAVAASHTGGLVRRLYRDVRGRTLDRAVALRAAVSTTGVERVVDRIAATLDRPAKNARVVPKPLATGLTVVPDRTGLAVKRPQLVQRLTHALLSTRGRRAIAVPIRPLHARWTTTTLARKLDTYLLVSRETFTLRLYKQLKLVKTYPIAVGMAGLETPAGLYDINDKQINPSWHVPNSAWAGDLAGRVIPPGPDDPIKARWLGFYDGAGIHGTDEDWSIGSAASHGCIRMHIWDVEDLYDRVPLHTPIYVG
ncbi:MAG TPA: L,D-transpeptidase/peptidoglycan binding protein [Gaiellaceae bacterium]|nr:L,D-transpeptidase/peptidoglycan binding protein [Gaiellaceae bacterium]